MFKIKEFLTDKPLAIIPYLIFIFFFIVIGVNIIYITIASKSWRGVAIDDSYKKGISYNQTIEQVQKQKDLGWKISFKYQNLGDNKKNGRFVFNVTDKNNNFVNNALISVKFKRPTQDGFDFTSYSKSLSNKYYVDVIFPLLGNWEANIKVQKGEDIYLEKRKLVIQ